MQEQEEKKLDLKTELLLGIVLASLVLVTIMLIWLGDALLPFRPVIAGAFTVFVIGLLAIALWRSWVWANTKEPFLPRFQRQQPHETYESGYREYEREEK